MDDKLHLIVGAPVEIAQIVAQRLEQLFSGLGGVKVLIRQRRITVHQSSDIQIVQRIIGYAVGYHAHHDLVGVLLYRHAEK